MCEKGRRGQSVKKLVLHAARSERTIHSRSDEKNEEGDGKENPSRESWCASPEGSLSMSPSLCGLWHTPWISLYFNLSPVLWSTFFSACVSICIFLHTEWSTCLEIAESGLLEDQKKTERRKIEEHLINCEHVTSNSLLPWWAVATTASLSRE